MTNIDRIMDLIYWHRTEEEQQEGIALAREVKCLQAFFQPYYPENSKGVWDNCAKIICERSDEELKPYITEMLLWLEDLNWPGAEVIQQRLIDFQDVSWLALFLNSFVPALEKLGQTSWIRFIAELLSNEKLSQALKESTREIFTKYPPYRYKSRENKLVHP